ncbi:unnamed protein product [Microthlaspi erraticum]|uniref:Uncharacterized protein n=1 Tax=Microthlaspi erraticum TaxID=1685480 RepID=A0A6D2J754_9BRAS|nr:unnamed protein product [Microthlaspi erraticum]
MLSKRLALLGVRSAISVSKSSRGVGSSYGLIDRRRLFPYRQISDFTKDSSPPSNSQMETLEDYLAPRVSQLMEYGVTNAFLISLRKPSEFVLCLFYHLKHNCSNYNVGDSLRTWVERNRAEVETMRVEQAKAGFPFVYSPPVCFSNRFEDSQDRARRFPGFETFYAELEKNRKLLAELEELREMRLQLMKYVTPAF